MISVNVSKCRQKSNQRLYLFKDFSIFNHMKVSYG